MRRIHAWILMAFAFAGDSDARSRRSSAPPTVSFGNASWYGWWHEGRLTADGSRFHAMIETAASLTLPLGSWVKITNLGNGQTAVVRITDRGPHVRGRIIDVSLATANRLGMVRAGVARVRIEIIEAHE